MTQSEDGDNHDVRRIIKKVGTIRESENARRGVLSMAIRALLIIAFVSEFINPLQNQAHSVVTVRDNSS